MEQENLVNKLEQFFKETGSTKGASCEKMSPKDYYQIKKRFPGCKIKVKLVDLATPFEQFVWTVKINKGI